MLRTLLSRSAVLLRAAALGIGMLSGAAAHAQTCASPGLEGPATASGVVNSYHAGSGSPAAGATAITVASATGQRSNTRQLRAGDMVVVMQMQDSATPANAGIHEYAHIASITGTNITLRTPLANSYVQSVSTTSLRTWQVIWVPQYAVLTISGAVTPDRWTINATSGAGTGGVVALDVADALTLSGSINASGAGFRGGAGLNGSGSRAGGTYTDADYNYSTASVNGSVKGEGIEGTPFLVFDGTAAPLNYATLLGQGYAAGAGGRGARSNAGGGGNDGNPGNQTPPGGGSNEYNSGGGGGANGGAGGRGGNAWNSGGTTAELNLPGGGNTGNAAGGAGGAAQANSATRLVLGGGGGAGSANNGSTNAVTTWPPTSTGTVANGADGAITSSGASGGGVVLVRARTVSGGGSIIASGYSAYNKSPVGDTDAAGGGGAGGSVYLVAASGTGAGITINASGGSGGSSNYYNHGPGGGGGGGFIATNQTGATLLVTGGSNGTDGCCGGTTGNLSPKAYNSAPGSAGATNTAPAGAAGATGGASCLPALTLVKTTTTPLRVVPTDTTAQYVFTITNPATGSGAAYGVAVRDAFPVPFGLAATGATASFAVSGAGTRFNGSGTSVPNSSGVTPTVQLGVPGGMTNTFTVFPGGSVTLVLTVVLNTTTAATFQNSATVTFIDPTRVSGSGAATSGLAANPTVSPGQAFANGAVAGGSNYAAASSTGEDVRLVNGTSTLTVTKTNTVSVLYSGQTTSYTVTVANLGPTAAPGTLLQDPAVPGLSCTAVSCSVTGGAAACPAAVTLSALQSTGISLSPTFPAASSLTFRVSCDVTATGS